MHWLHEGGLQDHTQTRIFLKEDSLGGLQASCRVLESDLIVPIMNQLGFPIVS